MDEFMSDGALLFLTLTFLFAFGCLMGWTLELFFRRFLSKNNPEKKWINPGFLVGPALPLYGFGLTMLFIMSLIPLIGSESMEEISLKKVIIAILAMGVVMTLIEYIAGLIFIKGMKIKLWDYSNEWGNIQGIICPLFSLIWTVLAALYYFFIQPFMLRLVSWFYHHIAFTFVVGMFFGIFVIDLCYSVNVVSKVRGLAKEYEVVVKYQVLKSQIRKERDEVKAKGRFLLALTTDKTSLAKHLVEYIETLAGDSDNNIETGDSANNEAENNNE